MAVQIFDATVRPEYSKFFLVLCWDVDCKSWCRVQLADSPAQCLVSGFQLLELYDPKLRPFFEVWWAGLSLLAVSHRPDVYDHGPYDYPLSAGVYHFVSGKRPAWRSARWEHPNAA